MARATSPSPTPPPSATVIETLDFDTNRRGSGTRRSEDSSRRLLDDDVSLMSELAADIVERDRQRMRIEVMRVASFACAVLSCLCAGSITSFSLYGPRFLVALRYTQFRVNAVSVTAELAMYLPVPLFGALCDRYSPPPLSLLAAVLFGVGYLLAALTYRSGPPGDAGGDGWPFGVMILAFVGVGAGTSCMYLSAVATCAKNYARAKSRGFMLAVPIAAFGLSGMWQSQVGAHLLYERLPDGGKGDVDVFRYFVFLGATLFAVGLLGAVGLRIVDEEYLINHGVEELERSGFLDESDFFRPAPPPPNGHTHSRHQRRHSHGRAAGYGTLDSSGSGEHGHGGDDYDTDTDSGSSGAELTLTESMVLKRRAEAAALSYKKRWLLNRATRAFLTDRTMWLLAAGFFLLTGPSEAYINNVGTIIPTLTPPGWIDIGGGHDAPAGRASDHVSIIALMSTLARLGTGTLSDLFAPTPADADDDGGDDFDDGFGANDGEALRRRRRRVTFSRLTLLLPSAGLLLLCFLMLAVPALVPAHPPLFLAASAMLGLGYGGGFSLVPIVISVVWGVENFATNWGVVAMMPAGGAALSSILYSIIYERTRAHQGAGADVCVGRACFEAWAWASVACVAAAMVLWAFAWRTWARRRVVV